MATNTKFGALDQAQNTNIANTTFNDSYREQLKTDANAQIPFLNMRNSIPNSQHVTENSSLDGLGRQLNENNYSTGQSTSRPAGVVDTIPINDIKTPASSKPAQRFVNVTQEEQTAREHIVGANVILRGLSEKIDDLKSQLERFESLTNNNIISNDVFSDLQLLSDAIKEVSDIMMDVQNINEKTNIGNLAKQVENISNTIKDAINVSEFKKQIESNYEEVLEKVNKETAEKINEQFSAYKEVLSVFENIPKFIDESINVETLQTFFDLVQKVVDAANDAGNVVSDVAENVNDLADDVSGLSDQTKSGIDAAEQVGETIKDVSEHIKLLQQQYGDSVKAIDEVEKVTDTYLRNVQDAIAGNVNTFMTEIKSLMDKNDTEAIVNLLNPETSGSFGEIPKTIAEVVSQLNETAETAAEQDNGLESMVKMIQGIRLFSSNTTNIMDSMYKNIKEMGEKSHNDDLLKSAENLKTQIDAVRKVQETTNATLHQGLNEVVLRQSTQIQESLKNVNKPGTKEYMSSSMDLAQKFTDTSIQNIGYAGSNLQNVSNALMMGNAYHDAGQQGILYRMTFGNFLGNRDKFAGSVEAAQRTNIQSQMELPKMFEEAKKFKAAGNEKDFKASIENIAKIANENALSHMTMMKNVNLHRGQYDKLSQEDKNALDSSIASSENAAQSLSQIIAALSQLDPENKTLDTLKKTNKELLNTTQHIKDIKAESNPIADIFKAATSGVKSILGVITAGAGLMGLSAIIPTPGNIKNFISKSFDFYKEDGQRRYDLSRARQAMGASISPGMDSYLINDLADRYYEMSVGNIGFDQTKNFYTNLAYNVGGHYGSNPEQASKDMQAITNNTFALAYSYNMSDSDVSNFMKTYYKDMRMSVTDASYMMVKLAQSAQQAGIPVANYVSALTNMTSSLREYGMSAESIAGMMDTLINSQGLRMEDAQGLVNETAKANRNMANDWGMSGFFGMVSGQSGDFFGNIAAGLTPIDSQGNVNKGWSQMMTQRLFSETGLMGGIGGGPGSPLGAMMVSNQLNKRGYSQRSVSMLTDAYANNDMELFQTLLEQAEEEKDGAQEKLTKAMQDAEKSITASGTQMSGISKIQAEVTLAEKKLGEAIYTHLDKPLANFKDIFKKGLAIVVGALKRVAKALGEFFNSDLGKKALDNPGYLAAGGVGILAGGKLAMWGAKRAGKALFSPGGAKGASGITKTLLAAAKTSGGKIAAIATALALVTTFLPKIVDIFTNGSFSATLSGLWEGLKSFFGFGSSDPQKEKKKFEAKKTEESLFDELAREGGYNESELTKKTEEDLQKQAEEIYSGITKDTPIQAGATSAQDYQKQKEAQIKDPMAIAMKNAVDKYGDMDEDDLAEQFGEEDGGFSPLATTAMHAVGYGVTGAQFYYQGKKLADQAKLKAGREARLKVLKDYRAKQNAANKAAASGRWSHMPSAANARQEAAKAARQQAKSAATKAAEKAIAESSIKNLGMKAIARSTAPLTAGISVFSEVAKYNANPEQFTMGQRVARVGIDIASTVGGAMIGSMLGPAGMMAGGMLGSMAGDQLKKLLKISDEDGKTYAEKYEKSSTFAAGKYTDNTNSLVNSNDARQKAAAEGLSEHNIKLTELTKEQQAKLDQIFNELKNLGMTDLQAALAASSTLGGFMNEQSKATYSDKEKSLEAVRRGLKEGGLQGFDENASDLNKSANEDKISRYKVAETVLSKDLNYATKDYMYRLGNHVLKYKNQGHTEVKRQAELFAMRNLSSDTKGGTASQKQIDDSWKYAQYVLHMGDYEHLGKGTEEYALLSGNMRDDSFSIDKYIDDRIKNDPDKGYNRPTVLSAIGYKDESGGYNTFAQGVSNTSEGVRWEAAEKYPDMGSSSTSNTSNENKKSDKGNTTSSPSPSSTPGFESSPIMENMSSHGLSSEASSGRMHPVKGYVRPHKGNDYGAHLNDKVFSAMAGKVTEVDVDPDGWGKYVTVDHGNGLQTRYAHFNNYAEGLQVGQEIKAGQLIGFAGKTGSATGEHVHFEVLKDGQQVIDPDYIDSIAQGKAPGSTSVSPNAAGATPGEGVGGTSSEEFRKKYGNDLFAAAEANREQAKKMLEAKGLAKMDYSDKIASGRLILDGTTAFSRDRSVFMTPEGVRGKFLLNSGVKQSDLYGYTYNGYYDDKGTFHETGAMKIIQKEQEKRLKEFGHLPNYNKMISLRSPAEEKRQEAINKAKDDAQEARKLAEERYEAKDAEKTGTDINDKNSVDIRVMPIGGEESKGLKERIVKLETFTYKFVKDVSANFDGVIYAGGKRDKNFSK